MALAMVVSGPVAAAELIPRGVFEWQEDREGFGGFSGLAFAGDGASFLTVSDEGAIFRAQVGRDEAGRITGISTEWQGRLLDRLGKPLTGFTADAEALAVGPDGTTYVGYESYTRITSVTLPELKPTTLHTWDRFRDFWGNEGFEALAVLSDGDLIAIRETAEEGSFGTFIGHGRDWRPGPALPADGDFAAADAVFGPDGMLYLLERRLSYVSGFATRIRRFAYEDGRFGPPETLLETQPGTLDNMEGISLWTEPGGHIVISLISDDNFLFVQKTILSEYELRE